MISMKFHLNLQNKDMYHIKVFTFVISFSQL